MTTGRNFDEVLRVIDSLQLTAKHQVATPVNWLPGEDVIIAGSVSDEEAKRRYPQGWKAPKPYLRIVRSRNRFAVIPSESREIPQDYFTIAPRDPSTSLRSAQDDDRCSSPKLSAEIPPDPAENSFVTQHRVLDGGRAAHAAARRMLLLIPAKEFSGVSGSRTVSSSARGNAASRRQHAATQTPDLITAVQANLLFARRQPRYTHVSCVIFEVELVRQIRAETTFFTIGGVSCAMFDGAQDRTREPILRPGLTKATMVPSFPKMLCNLSFFFHHVRQWINENRKQAREIIRFAVQQ